MADPIDFAALFKIPVPTQLDHNATVIVVEDQQDLRLIIAHQLAKLQFTKVKQASNGYEALEVMRESRDTAMIMCDMEMPIMGGLELLQELRESPDLPRPPFCMSLDNVSREKVMLVLENGVDDILVKPFTLGDIHPKVQSSFKVFHNPKNPEKAYELAKQKLRDKNYDESEKIYKILADANDKSARPHVGLARVYLAQGNPHKAIETLAAAENRNKNYVHTFAVRGEVYVAMQKFDDAFKAFESAIKLSPLNPVRYVSAVDLLFKKQKYKEAVGILEKAVAHGLDFKELHNYLSQAYFHLKEFSKAVRHVKSALNADPENVIYLNQLGICMKYTNQLDEAQKVYNQIIKLDPENVAALYNKALLLETKGDLPEAIKNLDRAVKKDPQFKEAIAKLNELKTKSTKTAS
jgi:tetratricopeptide (TPR) repeat protein